MNPASLMVVLSDLHDPDASAALRHAAQRHDVIVIHLLDPAEVGGLRAGFMRGREAETGSTFLAGGRTRWMDHLEHERDFARAGASYLQLRTDQPFIPKLRNFLISRIAARRGRV